MKWESKEITNTVKHVATINPEVIKELNVREALLFCDILGKKKGEIYEQVYNDICEHYGRTLEEIGSTFSYKFWEVVEKDGKKVRQEIKILSIIISQFPEYPKTISKREDGTQELSVQGFTWCQKQITLDKERAEEGKERVLTDEQVRAINAINSFKTWASTHQAGLIGAIKNDRVEARVKEKLDTIIADAEAKGLDILPAHLEEKAAAERSKAKEELGFKKATPRVFDGSGNIKEQQVKDLPEKPRLELVKTLVNNNPQEVAKALEAVTGKHVSFAPKLEELRAIDLIEGLRAKLADFKEPKTAGKLLNELQLLLIEEAEPVSIGETTVKGRAKSNAA